MKVYVVVGEGGREPVVFSDKYAAEDYEKRAQRDAEMGGSMRQEFQAYAVIVDSANTQSFG